MTAFQARLLAAAVRAPSGDNCQPWSFLFEGPYLVTVQADLKRAKSFFDYEQSATALSIGAVVENMRVQAASEGFVVHVTYGRESEGPHGATLLFSRDATLQVPRSRVEALFVRTVNRRPFLPMRLSRSKVIQLLEDPVPGTSVHVISQRQAISQWAHAIELADRIRYSHPEIHEELFSKLLFTQTLAQEVRVGLEVDRLGLGPFGRTFLQWLRPWERVQRLSRWGLVRILAGQSGLLARSTGALVLVTIANGGRDSWIKAGEQVQRLWIRAHELGLQTHPMPVALFLDQRYQQEGYGRYLPHHHSLLKILRERLAGLIREGIGAMVFRIGYGWKMKGQSVRLEIEKLMENNRPFPR